MGTSSPLEISLAVTIKNRPPQQCPLLALPPSSSISSPQIVPLAGQKVPMRMSLWGTNHIANHSIITPPVSLRSTRNEKWNYFLRDLSSVWLGVDQPIFHPFVHLSHHSDGSWYWLSHSSNTIKNIYTYIYAYTHTYTNAHTHIFKYINIFSVSVPHSQAKRLSLKNFLIQDSLWSLQHIEEPKFVGWEKWDLIIWFFSHYLFDIHVRGVLRKN